MLSGKTSRVVISFSDFYQKTERNLKNIDSLIYSDITKDIPVLLELSQYMANIAQQNGMKIQSCAEHIDTSSAGVPHGKCIDKELIREVFGISLNGIKDKGQREECGCIKSIDIGSYNTCLHECSYCYATFNKNTVIENRKEHNPDSPFLIGNIENYHLKLLETEGYQETLF